MKNKMKTIDKIRSAYFIVSLAAAAGLEEAPLGIIALITINFGIAAWQVNKIFEEEKQQ